MNTCTYFERACIALKHDMSEENIVGTLYCNCQQNKTNKQTHSLVR